MGIGISNVKWDQVRLQKINFFIILWFFIILIFYYMCACVYICTCMWDELIKLKIDKNKLIIHKYIKLMWASQF